MSGGLTEHAFQDLLNRDPQRGWRAFIDQYTPVILGMLQRSGLRDRDEMLEVYTLVAERLVANDCAKLRARSSGGGSLEAWLSVVARHAVVDWIRSRAGRRRLFGVVKDLSETDQRVFELYYWEERRVAEISGILSTAAAREFPVSAVLDALGRINAVLTTRHHSELLSMATRRRTPEALDAPGGGLTFDPEAAVLSPEEEVLKVERERQLHAALAALPAEDAAIVRLHIGHGLTLAQVRQALRLPHLTPERLHGVLDRLKQLLMEGHRDPSHA
jgi:DNA-directed RNA polymerase specialized sigma24 family protein